MMLYTLSNRRDIIDRRHLNAAFAAGADEAGDAAAMRALAVNMARAALAHGRDELCRRAVVERQSGRQLTQGYSFLTDQILGFLWEATRERLCPLPNPTDAERLAIAAVGGYGRAEMAPYSDVDLLFLTPYKQTSWGEQSIETLLYMLWDLGLKVGHATRSVAELIRMAKDDITVRTAFLECRLLHGDVDTFRAAKTKFQNDVVKGTGAAFVAEKLAERDARHKRMGDSRYVVEPNVKEGKGGLRDLHTLFWIAKYIYRVDDLAGLVDKGVLSAGELRVFRQAENFLWTVRCHLHLLSKRAEERLTFDVQPELARRLGYGSRPGQRGVERFMKHYFLTAKRVGHLTRIFCANLEDSQKKTPLLARLPGLRRRIKKLEGFVLDGDRLSVPSDDFFRADPVRMIQIFEIADRAGVDLHPNAMRLLQRDRKRVDASVRADARANAYFMAILTSPRDPETALRRMNEAGIFGRFVPDFGRVEAQMQYDMYHHYTVDEHTIRAIGLLARIEKGELAEDHPLSTHIMPKILSRRVLYVAVLLHDIAKG
ncbi:MAG: [protein-PII] uridylyltransferase, partial [Alphaproteobacteria bacterium]